ncbi:MAG: trigger factor [Bacteroidales bacterium]|nr:trigger factor [Bacteroidales bacterium]
MEIVKENVDSLNAVIRLRVQPSDYEERVNGVLKDYRKKVKVDGFRPGMVPMGLVKKMYYKPVLVDEVNKLVSESLFDYIREQQIKMLGEPLLHREDEKKLNFDSDREFEFAFDIGLAPDLNVEVTSKDKIPYYNIKLEKKGLQEYRENVQRRYGDFKAVEEAGDSELIKGNLVEVDENNNVAEGGIFSEGISMSLDMMKDEEERKRFKGAKAGDEVLFDLKKAYPNDAELASLLRIRNEEVPSLSGRFKCRIDEIKKFEKAAVDQELFDKIYGEGAVDSEEEFEKRLAGEMQQNYRNESEYRFAIDAREVLLKKAKVQLPVEFLKRWLVEKNENMTSEQVERDFDKYEDDFRWQLIRDYLVEKLDIRVSEEEALETAKAITLNQYMQYGISSVPDDYLTKYAKEMLSKNEEARRIYDRRAEEKLIRHIRDTARVDEKEITMDKFRKLFE